jgi:hypothetical protein
MLGRTAGVVALRDGLYYACQAYANQLIGKDAYALILSQYGNLLVALAAGGSGATSSTSSTPSSTPSGVAVAVSAGAPPSASNPSERPPSGGASQANTSQVAQIQQHIQAFLVACVSYYDRSIPHAPNYLLNQYCGDFMKKLSDVLPELLKPPAPPSQTVNGATPVVVRHGAAPRPAPARHS